MKLLISKIPRATTVTLLVAEILIIIFVKLAPIGATSQVATLYGDDGSTLTISGQNSPDLSAENFDNKATRCQVQGRWILYSDYNYVGAFQLITNELKELEHYLKGKVSSIRLVGSSDSSNDNTITLYQGINFQGAEFYTAKETSFGGSASSLIVTGSEPWTIFETNNFGGASACVYPGKKFDIYDIGIPNNIIGSVRLGCIG